MPPRLLLLTLLAALLIAPAQPASADVIDGFTVSPRPKEGPTRKLP